jgi:hypothetical protein
MFRLIKSSSGWLRTTKFLQSGYAHLGSQMAYNMCRDLRLRWTIIITYCAYMYVIMREAVYACGLPISGLLIGFLVDVSVVVVVLVFLVFRWRDVYPFSPLRFLVIG